MDNFRYKALNLEDARASSSFNPLRAVAPPPPPPAIKVVVEPDQVHKLRLGHALAATAHGLSAIVILVLLLVYGNDRFLQPSVTIMSLGQSRLLYRWPVAWLIFAFSAVTFVFHIIYAWFTVERVLRTNGTNPLRWLEYAMTATMMTVVIAQLSSVTDLLLLLFIAGATVVMNLLGYWHERINTAASIVLQKAVRDRQRQGTVPRAGSARLPPPSVQWHAYWLAWVMFVAAWSVIFYGFFDAVIRVTAPWFVYTIFIGTFFGFAAFGVLMALHYTSPSMVETPFLFGYPYELAWIILSVTNKMFLVWISFIGMLTTASQ